ncbi:hypothetical protein PSYMO_27939 [Pseudomonas amygdali pv. mori str. 301020]|uniref:Uncharacterized protein n=1 Tax=Pseudomonas amygdali pv. mori str. 301020 TaxID=629261 RepID=A0A656GHQ2_PSEA0|nr:hypothetical protein PSYMO_27939 [Pseudomonas amygdali pv. mori str. 301020]
MRHVHQVHGLAGQIDHLHADLEQPAGRAQGHARAGPVMVAEALHVFIGAAEAQISAVLVFACLQPGIVHRCAGHFAVQRVIILGLRATVAQQAAVKHEAAVGADHAGTGPRLGEHIEHGQINAVEFGRPDHLPLPRQDYQLAAAVFQ